MRRWRSWKACCASSRAKASLRRAWRSAGSQWVVGIAIQLAYRGSEIGSSLAAVFALSSFATDDSAMWSSLRASPDRPRPPLYQRHGDADDYILTEWGERTGKRLKDEGVAVDFGLEPGLRHSLSEDELVRLGEWLKGAVGE